MKDNLIIMIYMVMEYMYGQIIVNIKENGKEIKCMVKVQQHGQMEEVMRESNIIYV
jgi:hypothetical protein